MKTEEKTKGLVFNIGEESIPTVLDGSNYKQSPFAEVIDKGISIIDSLVRSENTKELEESDSYPNSYLLQVPNNVVAFLGDRGSGKTSSMLSVLQVLKDKKKKNGDNWMDDVQLFNVIDPSFFDEQHNILQIFLGEFYRNFQQLVTTYSTETTDKRAKLKELQSEFKSIKESISYFDYKKKFEAIDELHALAHLSAGVAITRSIGKLVERYLDFIGKKCLLLVIDDLDLNILSSYEMMEQIRKYLCLPNVIILMGAKLEQLKIGITHYLNRSNEGKALTKVEIEEMADRYLIKFLPLSQRIVMPEIGDLMKMPLKINLSDFEIIDGNTVDETVLSLIFKKTRYLFYNYANESSLIIPRNLRSLRMLVSMLATMSEPDSKTPSIHLSNKAAFKNYIVEEWIPNHISEYKKFALSLIEESNVSLINKRVIEFIVSISPKLKAWSELKEEAVYPYPETALTRIRLLEVIDEGNANGNLSVGDVSFIIHLSRRFENDDTLKYLFFFIDTFYSIKLYELYDEMTSSEVLGIDGFIDRVDTPTTIPELKKDTGIDVPEYVKLVGGSFFTLIGDSFIPLNSSGPSREIKLIDGRILGDEIRRLIDEAAKEKKIEEKDKFVKRLRLIEFFVLCSVRRVDLKNGKKSFEWYSQDNYRSEIDEKYFCAFGSSIKNVMFSPTAPFFTMIYPKWAYSRYNDKLYEIASNCEGSILYELLHQDWKRGYKNHFHTIMSAVGIRNMEIRNDIERWLKSRRDNLRPNKNGDIGVFASFFHKFSGSGSHSYSIKTYDKEEKGSFHEITFSPIHLLADVMLYLIKPDKVIKGESDEQTREELRILFDTIYSPSDRLEINRYYSLAHFMESLLTTQHPDAYELRSMIESFAHTYNDDRVNSIVLARSLAHMPKIIEKDLLNMLFSQELVKLYINEVLAKNEREFIHRGDRIKDLENEIKSCKKEKAKYEKERSDILKKIETAQEDLNKVSEQQAQLISKIGNVNTEKNDLEERGKSLAESLKDSKKQLDTVSFSLKLHESKLAEKNANLNELNQSAKNAANNEELENIVNKKAELERERNTLVSDIETLKEESKKYTDKINIYMEGLDSIHNQMTKLVAAMISFSGNLKVIDLKVKEKKSLVESLHKGMAEIAENTRLKDKRISQLEKSKRTLDEELITFNKNLKSTRDRLKSYI